MRAIVATEPGKLDVVEIAAPKVGPYQALVKTEVAVLCNATDSKLLSGHFPGMDAFPMVLGHEGAGIIETVGEKVKSAFLIGEAADRIAREWQGVTTIIKAATLKQAIDETVAGATQGDVVILSPGCSSFDMFSSFEERGDVFKNLVHGLV